MFGVSQIERKNSISKNIKNPIRINPLKCPFFEIQGVKIKKIISFSLISQDQFVKLKANFAGIVP